MKILHITTHVGGGVGRVLLEYFKISKHTHHVFCLGYYLGDDENIISDMANRHEDIIKVIPDYDIVLIHYWNHPLLFDFLVRNKLPPCRLVMWGHISGLHLPNIYSNKILDYPDIMVFTSPMSFNTVDYRDNLYQIWSTGGVDDYASLKKREHKNFIIGYVGTVDYAKMHTDFLKMCEAINIPDARFLVVGGPKEEELYYESLDLENSQNFLFTGYVDNLEKYYSKIDVFGYPLAPHHYGTCDQVIQFAMAMGIPCVVMNNPMENTILKHMETGLIANDTEEYVKYIELLYNDKELRNKISMNAKKEALERFSLNTLENEWDSIFNMVYELEKEPREWITDREINPKNIFLESLGENANLFDDEEKIKELGNLPMWQSETKGTVHNYVSYFDDETLKKWSKIMRN